MPREPDHVVSGGPEGAPSGRRAIVVVATLGYVGFFPVAPGTTATLVVGIPCVLVFARFHWVAYLLATAAIAALSCLTADRASRELGAPDNPKVVIDELAGYFVAMFLLPANWQMVAVSFILFRFFDVLKPWPVCWADREVHGGVGITLDDILAGVYAMLVGHVLLVLWPAAFGRT